METVLFNHAHERDKVRFFTSITNLLSRNKYNIINLAFSRQELSNYHKLGIKPIFMPRELKRLSQKNDDILYEYDLDELLSYTVKFNILNDYKISINKLKKVAEKYLLYLEKLKENVNLSLIVIWNNTFLFDALAKEFAIKNEIPYRVFEAGLFRPNTITIDPVGVNANNSVPREKSFFKNVNITEKETELSEMISLELPKSNIRYVLNRISDIICTKLGYQEETRIIYESLTKKILRNTKSISNSNNFTISTSNEYIFVPFQVKDDSQILQNSMNFKSMYDLVSFLISEVREWNKANGANLNLVFKEHPADTMNYNNLYQKYSNESNVVFLNEGNTQELIRNSKIVITINSTVGLEAIGQHKKVITLGNAFYNIEDIAIHCDKPNEFQQCLDSAISKNIDDELIDNFLNYLRFEYQLAGNWREGKFNEKQMLNKLGLVSYE